MIKHCVKSIELYSNLISRIDDFEAKLLAAYAPHIRCAAGCSSCCILESVFPVEACNIYQAVTAGVGAGSVRAAGCEKGKCVFLSDGLCSIYRCRPVICRTHGYPIFTDGRVDFCPENFKGIKSIDSGHILDIGALNRALVTINLMFLKENNDEFFSAERITLADLKKKILSYN